MFTVIGGAIGLLSAIVALIAWYLKRKRSPTIEERKADVRERFQDTVENVYRLRQQGNHAEADAMLRRLADASIVPDAKQPAKPDSDPNGKRLGADGSEGKPDPSSHGS